MKIKNQNDIIGDTSKVNKVEVITADINELTKNELKDPSFVPSLFQNYQGKELDNVLSLVLDRAKSLRILTEVKKVIE